MEKKKNAAISCDEDEAVVERQGANGDEENMTQNENNAEQTPPTAVEQGGADEIKELGTVPGGNILTVSIIGQVEGHYLLPETQKTTKYEHILPLLSSAEQDFRIKGLLVIINTVGGDVEAGLAIAEMLAGMSKPTVSLILGGGHSIGLPIACACGKSFCVPSASMTVHPVRITGTVIGVPQSFVSLDKMQERVNGFIVSHSRITDEKLTELMTNTGELATDVGSVISGKEAVEAGLIDAIGGISDAYSALREEMAKRGI